MFTNLSQDVIVIVTVFQLDGTTQEPVHHFSPAGLHMRTRQVSEILSEHRWPVVTVNGPETSSAVNGVMSDLLILKPDHRLSEHALIGHIELVRVGVTQSRQLSPVHRLCKAGIRNIWHVLAGRSIIEIWGKSF